MEASGAVVWRERDAGTWRVRARVRTGADSWAAPVWLSPAGANAERPHLAVFAPLRMTRCCCIGGASAE